MEPKKLLQILIDNKTRYEKGLSIMEYCLLVFVNYCIKNKLLIEHKTAWELYGIDKVDYLFGLRQLKDKKIITNNPEHPGQMKFDESYFESFNSPFEEFWSKYLGLVWPGSKKQSMILFDHLAKKHGGSFLIECKKDYFEFIIAERTIRKFDRSVMGAPVFLSDKTERFMEPWKTYTEQLRNPSAKKLKDPLEKDIHQPENEEQLKKLFAVKEDKYE